MYAGFTILLNEWMILTYDFVVWEKYDKVCEMFAETGHMIFGNEFNSASIGAELEMIGSLESIYPN